MLIKERLRGDRESRTRIAGRRRAADLFDDTSDFSQSKASVRHALSDKRKFKSPGLEEPAFDIKLAPGGIRILSFGAPVPAQRMHGGGSPVGLGWRHFCSRSAG